MQEQLDVSKQNVTTGQVNIKKRVVQENKTIEEPGRGQRPAAP